jgi:hypothetical protein
MLLEKKGKNTEFLNNLRPITLTNCDVKLITTTATTTTTSSTLTTTASTTTPTIKMKDKPMLKTIKLCVLI